MGSTTMSNIFNQAVMCHAKIKPPARDLDLDINAIDSAVVRMPFAAGAMDLRATKTVLGSAVRMPFSASATTLRATGTVLTLG